MNTISIVGFLQDRPRNRKGVAHRTSEDWDALDDMGLKENGDLSPSFDTDEVVASDVRLFAPGSRLRSTYRTPSSD